MSDLISRQAAIDAIDEYDFEFPKYMERFVTELRDAMKADLKNDIEALPPAQTERKTGRWIRGGAYPHHIFCSACYATYVPNDEWDIWKADGTYCWRLPRRFCPNCGAKMEEVSG